jgi:hypothetical protein
MGVIKAGTDPIVADERRLVDASYRKLRTTREGKATDRDILADIRECTLKASAAWLGLQFRMRAIRGRDE